MKRNSVIVALPAAAALLGLFGLAQADTTNSPPQYPAVSPLWLSHTNVILSMSRPLTTPQSPVFALLDKSTLRNPGAKFQALERQLFDLTQPSILRPKSAARPQPGIYETAPYTSIVIVPGPQPDDRALFGQGTGNFSMPTLRPGLRFIPRTPPTR